MSARGRAQDVWKATGNGTRPPDRPGKRTSAGARRWFLAALLSAGVIGSIIGLLIYLWPVPEPVILAIPVTAYDGEEWPPNPWAEADARGLLQPTGADSALTFQAQEKSAIVRELNTLANDSRGRPVLVYLSALGVTANGTVYLIPSKGKLDDPTSWLTLDDVLSPLRRVGGSKLLILDVRPAGDARGLIVAEDVNEVLDATLARIDLPGFVLTANTPPEGPNVLRSLRRSAFGLALAQAAGGAADGWNPDRKRNGRVSAFELADYTCALTHYVSKTAELPLQTPRLYGAGSDFDLFRVPSEGPTPLPTPAEAEPYPQWLTDAWAERDRWFAEGLHRRAPRMVRQLTHQTARAERYWMAGVNPDTIRPPFVATFLRRDEVQKALGPIVQPARSVARVRQRLDDKAWKAVAAHFEEAFKLIQSPPPTDAAKVVDAAVKKLVPKSVEAEPFNVSAAVIFDLACRLDDPRPEQMQYLAAVVERFWPGSPEHAELITVQMIGKFPDELIRRWPAGTIAKLIQLARVAEEATACDGDCLPWVQERLKKADQLRRDAVFVLCNPESSKLDCLQAVKDLELLQGEYETIRGNVRVIMDAMTEQEETRAGLIDLATACPLDDRANAELAENQWGVLVENFQRLQQMLRSPSASPDVPKLQTTWRDLKAIRTNLLPRRDEFRGIHQLEQALRWPHWSVKDRQELLGRLAREDHVATTRVLQGWPTEPLGRDLPPPGKHSRRVTATALRDLGRWITVLQLADWPGAKDLATDFERLGATPPAPAVEALARKVRAATRAGLAERYAKTDHPRQAAFGWAVDPDEVPAFGDSRLRATPNPELSDRRRAEKDIHQWLARTRYSADADLFGRCPVQPVRAAAEGYGSIASAYEAAFRDHP